MGDAEADIDPEFNNLVVHNVDAMYKIAYARVGNAADAQDIVQDTFIKALVAFPQLRCGGNATNWLTKILVNQIRDFYRKGSRRAVTVPFNEQLNDSASLKPNPEEQLIDAEIDPSLSPRHRDVLKLRFGLEDGTTRTLEEVAQLFGVTPQRIRQIEAEALRMLRHPSRTRRPGRERPVD